MTEYWVINGHQPDCAYVLGLDDDNDERCCGGVHCDCAEWDDEEEEQFWDEDADVQS